MSPPPLNIDGTDITGATIDGQNVEEITIDGQTVFGALPDTAMFASPLYHYTAGKGLTASDGDIANSWTEQLAGAGDATVVDAPRFRANQAGKPAVEYDGSNDSHDFPTDGALPTGSSPVSFAATIYVKSTSTLQAIVTYGPGNTGEAVSFFLNNSEVRISRLGGSGIARGGSFSTGQWITVGGVAAPNDLEVYLNGSSVDTSGASAFNLKDSDRTIARRGADNRFFADIYINDLVICDARESDSAFSQYHTNRI